MGRLPGAICNFLNDIVTCHDVKVRSGGEINVHQSEPEASSQKLAATP